MKQNKTTFNQTTKQQNHQTTKQPKYNKYVEEGEAAFIAGFNEENKKLKATTKAGNADYTMTVEVRKIDYFFSATSIIPGHKNDIWVNVTMRDKAGNSACVTKIANLLDKKTKSV